MSKLLELMKKRKGNFVILQTPKILMNDDREDFWKVLREMYQCRNELTPEDRVAVSVLNSLYHHKKKIFCLTKRSLERLVLADSNWEKSPTYSPDRYSSQLKTLYDFGISRVTRADRGLKTPSIFFVSQDCLASEYFETDIQKQLVEALAFAKPKGNLIADTNFYEANREIFHQFCISPDPAVEDSLKKDQKKYLEKEREKEKEKEKEKERDGENERQHSRESRLENGHWKKDPVPDYHLEDLI